MTGRVVSVLLIVNKNIFLYFLFFVHLLKSEEVGERNQVKV